MFKKVLVVKPTIRVYVSLNHKLAGCLHNSSNVNRSMVENVSMC